jgi:hypothetical protein
VTAEDYLRDNLNFGLVHAVYQWAQGTTYGQRTHSLTVSLATETLALAAHSSSLINNSDHYFVFTSCFRVSFCFLRVF